MPIEVSATDKQEARRELAEFRAWLEASRDVDRRRDAVERVEALAGKRDAIITEIVGKFCGLGPLAAKYDELTSEIGRELAPFIEDLATFASRGRETKLLGSALFAELGWGGRAPELTSLSAPLVELSQTILRPSDWLTGDKWKGSLNDERSH